MKKAIPHYTFYKTKYGSELLIDVVDLKYAKKFLVKSTVHTLTYYDITFITEGEGVFSIDNQTHHAMAGDVFFTKPGEIRHWDTLYITNGHALIFEDDFLSSFFKDPLFVQHLPYFTLGGTACKLHLPDKLCITPNYLNEVVTTALKISAKQYIRNKVVNEAKRLLVYTDLSISEIAFELNFSTASYFVRSFKECTRETPLSYRQIYKP